MREQVWPEANSYGYGHHETDFLGDAFLCDLCASVVNTAVLTRASDTG
jgi:hypothetical protein